MKKFGNQIIVSLFVMLSHACHAFAVGDFPQPCQSHWEAKKNALKTLVKCVEEVPKEGDCKAQLVVAVQAARELHSCLYQTKK